MRNLILSPSTLDTIQACETKFHYSKGMLLAPNESSHEAMDRGTLGHSFLEHYYDGIRTDPKADRNQLTLDGIHKITVERAALTVPDTQFELLVKSLKEYPFFYFKDWEPVEIERPFSKVLFEDAALDLRVIIEGRIDLIAKLSGTSQHIVVDHKTVARASGYHKMMNQMAAYAWATGYHDVCMNLIGIQKSYSPAEKFKRISFSYQSWNLDDWVRQATETAVNIADAISRGEYAQQWASCRYCAFAPICEAMPEAKEHVISTQFKVNRKYNLFEE